ncbi:hypothetical protein AB1484_20195 [Parafrankia sp. FMc6]|uniref:hypothetical protein n=1 Tax=Parafrankia soli TaxID=2599596 RepID=UPI0034D46BE3
MHLDEAQIVSWEEFKDWQVVTSHPAFPAAPESVTSPFIDALGVIGGAYPAYFEAMKVFHGIVDNDWPKLERAFQFYLAENWPRFDMAISQILEEERPIDASVLMRYDLVHRLLAVTLLPLDPCSPYPELKEVIWQRAQPSPELIGYVRQPVVKKELISLQKRLFEQINHLILIRQAWTPALPLLWANRLGRPVPGDWRLPGEDFVVLRDAYRQNFELSCQALTMLVAIQNVVEGRSAATIRSDNEAAPWIPTDFSGKSAPRTLSQFRKLTAESKIAFLDRFPEVAAAWHESFDRNIRNAIAHADADIVVRSSEIATGKGMIIPYIKFVEAVIKQIQLLLLWLDLAKLFRVYSLPLNDVS